MSYVHMGRDTDIMRISFEEKAINSYLTAYGENGNTNIISELSRRFKCINDSFTIIMENEQCSCYIDHQDILELFSNKLNKLSKKIQIKYVPDEWVVELVQMTMIVCFYISLDVDMKRLVISLSHDRNLKIELPFNDAYKMIDLSDVCKDTMIVNMIKDILSPMKYQGDNELVNLLKSTL